LDRQTVADRVRPASSIRLAGSQQRIQQRVQQSKQSKIARQIDGDANPSLSDTAPAPDCDGTAGDAPPPSTASSITSPSPAGQPWCCVGAGAQCAQSTATDEHEQSHEFAAAAKSGAAGGDGGRPAASRHGGTGSNTAAQQLPHSSVGAQYLRVSKNGKGRALRRNDGRGYF
jgi:hypothetical protein